MGVIKRESLVRSMVVPQGHGKVLGGLAQAAHELGVGDAVWCKLRTVTGIEQYKNAILIELCTNDEHMIAKIINFC